MGVTRSESAARRDALIAQYQGVRGWTERLAEPLAPEDQVIQTAPFASPTKWHRAHTTWFFETFVLKAHDPDYVPLSDDYAFLFNSYYNTVGPQFTRAQRGLLSRPTVAEVGAFRRHVDDHVVALLSRADDALLDELADLIVMGCHHEQQHQELLLTDIKHVLAFNPLHPVYVPREDALVSADPGEVRWHVLEPGMVRVGFEGEGFCFDNETPRHGTYLNGAKIADRLVTNAEYQEFIADGGYERPEFWLDDGWHTVKREGWGAPLYWEQVDGAWWNMTLSGFREVDPHEPVCHVSFYEADALARWSGARLPTEVEWEVASESVGMDGNFVEDAAFHPVAGAASSQALRQMFGDVWEWTGSAYLGYPGYKPLPGALGEYNGKFMCNTFVLRGGSCATSRTHIRATYRNFFAPDARWQFTGIRLAKDLT